MAKLTDIVTLFDVSSRVVGGINSFVFDNMSAINADKQRDFLALLLKPPVGRNASTDRSMKDWDIDLFLFDIWNENSENETRKLQDVWQALEDKARELLDKVLEDRKTYGLVRPETEPVINYGYPQHNDKMVGVRFQFTLRVWYGC